jgi:hypothetical protein
MITLGITLEIGAGSQHWLDEIGAEAAGVSCPVAKTTRYE